MATLAEMVGERDPGRRCIIFKKTSTCRSANLGGYIKRYLDETKKRENAVVDGVEGSNVGNRLEKGKDYHTREAQGKVHVHGFLREEVYKQTGKHVHELEPGDLTSAIPVIWKRKVQEKNLKKTAHKIAFALDPELCAMMKMAGVPVDETLLEIIHNTFKGYVDEFYPGEELGYLAGIHHDKKHVHAHVLLYPQTGNGTPINISHHSRRRLSNGRTVRIDFQGYLKDTVEKLTKRMYLDKIRRRVSLQSRPPDVKAQSKLMLLASVSKVTREGAGTDPQMFWGHVLKTRSQLEAQVGTAAHAKVLGEIRAAYEDRLKYFNDLTPEQAEKNLSQAVETRAKLRREQETSNKEYLRASKDKSRSNPWKALQQLRRECFRAKKMVLKGKDLSWSLPSFLQHGEGRWFAKRMQVNDELGRTMKKVFEDYGAGAQTAATADKFRKDVKVAFGKTHGVAPGWVVRKGVVQAQLALLDRVQKELSRRAEQEIAEEKKKREKQRELRRRNFIKIQLLEIEILDAGSKLKGKKPIYLQQYEGWKSTGLEIPLEKKEQPIDPTDAILSQYITLPKKEGPKSEAKPDVDEILAQYITLDRKGKSLVSSKVLDMTKEDIRKNAPRPLPEQKADAEAWSKERQKSIVDDVMENLDL